MSAVALAVLLRQYRAEYAMALGLVVSVILLALMPVLRETIGLLTDIASKSGFLDLCSHRQVDRHRLCGGHCGRRLPRRRESAMASKVEAGGQGGDFVAGHVTWPCKPHGAL